MPKALSGWGASIDIAAVGVGASGVGVSFKVLPTVAFSLVALISFFFITTTSGLRAAGPTADSGFATATASAAVVGAAGVALCNLATLALNLSTSLGFNPFLIANCAA